MSLFGSWTVTRVLRWYFESRTTLNGPRSVEVRPRLVVAKPRSATGTGPLQAVERVLAVGRCLDQLSGDHRRVLATAFAEHLREGLFEHEEFRRRYFGALARLGRLMRHRGVIS